MDRYPRIKTPKSQRFKTLKVRVDTYEVLRELCYEYFERSISSCIDIIANRVYEKVKAEKGR